MAVVESVFTIESVFETADKIPSPVVAEEFVRRVSGKLSAQNMWDKGNGSITLDQHLLRVNYREFPTEYVGNVCNNSLTISWAPPTGGSLEMVAKGLEVLRKVLAAAKEVDADRIWYDQATTRSK